ncbi:MAG: hypothetical protein H7246_05190 [Phycisphaerae bacterium]|nr:hypothetical protein [Saprospiraceae bacterium]
MKYEEIHEMLDRYWEGETTLEEERRIKTYFNSGGIDERLRPIAPLFQALREEQTVQLATKAKAVSLRPQMYQWAVAASLALLLAAGWCMFRGENARAPIANETPTELPKTIESPIVETPQKSLAVAEKTIPKPILPPKKSPHKRDKPKPTIDPETAQAMAEIKAALALVSSKLDKGRTQAVKGASYLDAMEKVPRRKAG